MKKIIKITSLLISILLAAIVLASCGKNDDTASENKTPTESNSTGNSSSSESATDCTDIINTSMSPKRFSSRLPSDDFSSDFNSIDTSSFSTSYNDNDEKYLTSPDGNFSVTYLQNDSGSVYAYKYKDISNGVNYYYNGSDGKIYCVSTEDYSGETMYYLDSNGELAGIYATTLQNYTEKVETVYNEKGKRVAAIYYADISDSSSTYFLDGSLNEITGDEYNDLTKNYIITVA